MAWVRREWQKESWGHKNTSRSEVYCLTFNLYKVPQKNLKNNQFKFFNQKLKKKLSGSTTQRRKDYKTNLDQKKWARKKINFTIQIFASTIRNLLSIRQIVKKTPIQFSWVRTKSCDAIYMTNITNQLIYPLMSSPCVIWSTNKIALDCKSILFFFIFTLFATLFFIYFLSFPFQLTFLCAFTNEKLNFFHFEL